MNPDVCTEVNTNLSNPVGPGTDSNSYMGSGTNLNSHTRSSTNLNDRAEVNTNQAVTQIKICGLMRAADVDVINQAKPDFAGFIFAVSRRQLTLTEAADLSARLDPSVKAVGVFSDQSQDDILQAVLGAKLDVVQLHGHEDDAYRSRLRQILTAHNSSHVEIWQMVAMTKPAREPGDRSAMTSQTREAGEPSVMTTRVQPERWLLDHVIPGQRGGTGQAFDWSTAVDLCRRYPIMLAGGLHQDNVAEAIHLLHPLGVDCSSGAETDGKKDPAKILRFCEAVRAADVDLSTPLRQKPTWDDRSDGLIGINDRSTGGRSR